MPSRISLNIHGLNVKNRQRLLDHLQVLQPPAVLVLDNLDLAREIKGLLPGTTVIFREYGSRGDGDLHLQSDPKAWLDGHAHQAKDGIVLHVLNEPPFNTEVMEWLTEMLRLAAPRGIPLIVGNWAVGNPQPEQWPMARDLLQLLDQYRNLFILGLHEYAGGVITSGLVGGNPTMIQPGSWPQDVSSITRFHMGRFKFLMNYCDSVSIRHPRIILTEHGFDDTSDIKAWEETLKKTAPYLNIRGWKTLRNQWQDWFGGLGWSAERAYFEQLAWADRTIYRNSPVEAQCIFCWGHSSQDWEQFDVAEAPEFQRLLEEYARTGVVSQPDIAPPAPALAPQPEITRVAPQPTPEQPEKPRRRGIGERTPEEIEAASRQPAVAPVGVRVESPQPPPATTTPTPEPVFVGSVVKPTPRSLEEAFTDEEIGMLVPALRAAAASGMFSQTVNDGFVRLADMLEQIKNKRSSG